MIRPPRTVFDTNVLVAGLRSRRGASFRLLEMIRTRRFQLCVTVPLVMEYDDVLARPGMVPLSSAAVDAVLDMVCREAVQQAVHFLWRPQLRDPKDELVLEAAVNARAAYLVTHNVRDFEACRFHGLEIVTPGQFLAVLEGDDR
ncbi:MAG: putative toxin-antitoxin system toxin component, PIN family [Proteobacteria bacterium]|nr:putative toxin-antitoxin system toxin component, PIN family [Pseudomonadota bacterium]MBS0555015.1 putative toxin-antitoxin system toxin component, PIN family [Pseudomonadota bacterium]